MEKKSFNWFLTQLAQRHIFLNILEVGICKRDKLLDWYCLDRQNLIKKKLIGTNYSKTLLNYFLSKKEPILGENPNKIVCYMYHKTGKKIVTAKEASEMANNQMHGLQVVSMHLALPGKNHRKLYRVTGKNVNNELHSEITVENYLNSKTTELKDLETADKIINFTMGVYEALSHFAKNLKTIQMDLTFSQSGQVYLIRTNELLFSKELGTESLRELHRIPSFKYREDPEIDEEIEPLSALLYSMEKDQKKKEIFEIKKSMQKNSKEFLDMMAKTIQKSRNIEANKRYFHERTNAEKGSGFFKRKVFRSVSQEDNLNVEIKDMTDLLSYIERTRPRNWVKDIKKSNLQIFRTIVGKNSIFNRRGSLGSLTNIHKEPASALPSQTMHYKNSKITYNMKTISPIPLSHRKSASTQEKKTI